MPIAIPTKSPQGAAGTLRAKSLAERLLHAAAQSDAETLGLLPAGLRALVGPEVSRHDTDLLIEIAMWFADAALRSEVADAVRALMMITAVEDNNERLVRALGMKRDPRGGWFVPHHLHNQEDQTKLLLRGMVQATLNGALLELTGNGNG